jgi:hypothetical protein
MSSCVFYQLHGAAHTSTSLKVNNIMRDNIVEKIDTSSCWPLERPRGLGNLAGIEPNGKVRSPVPENSWCAQSCNESRLLS